MGKSQTETKEKNQKSKKYENGTRRNPSPNPIPYLVIGLNFITNPSCGTVLYSTSIRVRVVEHDLPVGEVDMIRTRKIPRQD